MIFGRFGLGPLGGYLGIRMCTFCLTQKSEFSEKTGNNNNNSSSYNINNNNVWNYGAHNDGWGAHDELLLPDWETFLMRVSWEDQS